MSGRGGGRIWLVRWSLYRSLGEFFGEGLEGGGGGLWEKRCIGTVGSVMRKKGREGSAEYGWDW